MFTSYKHDNKWYIAYFQKNQFFKPYGLDDEQKIVITHLIDEDGKNILNTIDLDDSVIRNIFDVCLKEFSENYDCSV